MSAKTMCILAMLLIGLMMVGAPASANVQASVASPALIRSVIATGGGQSSGGAFTLHGTIGQSSAGNSAGGSFSLIAGFWFADPQWKSQLPLVVR